MLKNKLKLGNFLKGNVLRRWKSVDMLLENKQVKSSFEGLKDTVQAIREMNKVKEFEPNLPEDQKNSRKRLLIFRTNPAEPDDEPKLMSYYIGMADQRPQNLRADVPGRAHQNQK